jgi:class 3 adenylate cyclase
MTPMKMTEELRRNPKRRIITDAVILFADVMDSSTISDILNPIQYHNFISQFQTVAAQTVKESIRHNEHFVDCTIRGDELCLILCGGVLRNDIRIALTLAARMKAAFLSASKNRDRLNNGRNFFDIGIGIHTGRITLGVRRDPFSQGRSSRGDIKPEGYAINLAKRVESVSRDGLFSHITVSGALEPGED